MRCAPEGAGKGVAALCIGGGMGIAMVVSVPMSPWPRPGWELRWGGLRLNPRGVAAVTRGIAALLRAVCAVSSVWAQDADANAGR